MREQQSFGDIEFDSKKRKTRRKEFLEQMETVVPWKQ
jgi:hypothetical protein